VTIIIFFVIQRSNLTFGPIVASANFNDISITASDEQVGYLVHLIENIDNHHHA
jgi:hypothetical protein